MCQHLEWRQQRAAQEVQTKMHLCQHRRGRGEISWMKWRVLLKFQRHPPWKFFCINGSGASHWISIKRASRIQDGEKEWQSLIYNYGSIFSKERPWTLDRKRGKPPLKGSTTPTIGQSGLSPGSIKRGRSYPFICSFLALIHLSTDIMCVLCARHRKRTMKKNHRKRAMIQVVTVPAFAELVFSLAGDADEYKTSW